MITRLRNNKGYTVVELLVAMVLAGAVMAAVYSAYDSQQKGYLLNEQIVDAQQNLRAAMFLMERDIRMAGYDPDVPLQGAGIELANVDAIIFTRVNDTSGNLDRISYFISNNTDGDQCLYRSEAVPTPPAGTTNFDTFFAPYTFDNLIVAENVEALNIVYYREPGTAMARMLNNPNSLGDVPSSDIGDTESVHVTIVVRTKREDPAYTDTNTYINQEKEVILNIPNDNYHRRVLSKLIKCRNLGLEGK
jgi:type IV pilus assembly protein PilW